MSGLLSNQQKTYLSWLLTKQSADNSIDSLASTLIDSQVDLNPHQVDAALFAFKNPLSQGVLLADEVGLGKTIEAGLVIAQTWAERKKRILVITPANLRKQWYQELYDKFGLKATIQEAKLYNQLKKQGNTSPFHHDGVVICSYQFAKSKAKDLQNIAWDLVVIDEAHRLRNVYKKNNVTANIIKSSLKHVHNKVLLTATPLQNSLLELYGLVSILDERVFGDIESFKSQFIVGDKEATLPQLRSRLATVCKRTLRQQVQPFVSYTARRAIVQDFTPTQEEQTLRELVAEYLRRPNLQALPAGQRQLISLVLWKLLASSTQAIAGALATMIARLEKKLVNQDQDILDNLDDDYEALSESGDDYEELIVDDEVLSAQEKQAIEEEIEELKAFQSLAADIKQQAKGKALLTALEKSFVALTVSLLGGARGAAYAKTGISTGIYEIISPTGKVHLPSKGRCWISKNGFEELLVDNRIWWGKDGNAVPMKKVFLNESGGKKIASTFWDHHEAGSNKTANEEQKTLNIAKESFPTPKPEKLMERILSLATNKGDLVLDSFAGSGTTGAVAHKMGRRWIMVELGEHCHTYIIPRLKKVIEGEDKGGVTESTGWQGGGGFRYYKLAPSLMKKDQWDNWVINPEYNQEMLVEALCKLEGYTYAPSETEYWNHGKGSETDFIYVTTQTLTDQQLQAISEEVGEGRTLLIIASAWRSKNIERFENLTLRKIPNSIIKACEWGHDDYSLNVQNLPMSEPVIEEKKAVKQVKNTKDKEQVMSDLFGDQT